MKKDDFYTMLINNKVVIEDMHTTFIDSSVVIGTDTVIEPNNIIKGNCKIGNNVVLRAGNYIEDSRVGDRSEILLSRLNQAVVGAGVKIGPFSHLRPNSVVGDGCRIGNFVEIKNSTIGVKTKIAHLSYIGDAVVGVGVNMGCGVVTVNYDGREKHRTEVGNHAFIGSNVNLVAPVKIGEGAVVGAGSTITQNVPPLGLGIARAKQVNKDGWADKKG